MFGAFPMLAGAASILYPVARPNAESVVESDQLARVQNIIPVKMRTSLALVLYVRHNFLSLPPLL